MTASMWRGILFLADYRAWDGQPIKNDSNAILLSTLLPGCNSQIDKFQKIEFKHITPNYKTMVGDASDEAMCFYRVDDDKLFTVVQLTSSEKRLSSSLRELLTVHRALILKGPEISATNEFCTVFWITDNQNVPRSSGKAV